MLRQPKVERLRPLGSEPPHRLAVRSSLASFVLQACGRGEELGEVPRWLWRARICNSSEESVISVCIQLSCYIIFQCSFFTYKKLYTDLFDDVLGGAHGDVRLVFQGSKVVKAP